MASTKFANLPGHFVSRTLRNFVAAMKQNALAIHSRECRHFKLNATFILSKIRMIVRTIYAGIA